MIEDPAYQRIPPLSDLTVVEVAESVAGAFCGRMLAAFGARVIKVLNAALGCWTRYAEPQMKGYDALMRCPLPVRQYGQGERSSRLEVLTACQNCSICERRGCADRRLAAAD